MLLTVQLLGDILVAAIWLKNEKGHFGNWDSIITKVICTFSWENAYSFPMHPVQPHEDFPSSVPSWSSWLSHPAASLLLFINFSVRGYKWHSLQESQAKKRLAIAFLERSKKGCNRWEKDQPQDRSDRVKALSRALWACWNLSKQCLQTPPAQPLMRYLQIFMLAGLCLLS